MDCQIIGRKLRQEFKSTKRKYMKLTLRHPCTLQWCLVGLMGALLVGCQSSGARNTGQKMSDRSIASSVKKGLAADPTFKYEDVQAIVYDGNVQLTGFVDTSEQRMRAAEIASHTRGAKQVINAIMIKPTPTGPVTIRDPLGRDTGKILLDTNAPPPRLRNLPSSTTPAQPTPSEETTPR